MTVYNKYAIEVNLIPGLPDIPFETGNHKAGGVVMHSTANYAGGNDNPDGERNYEANGGWQNAFAHTFTGADKIEQVADYDYGAWHAYHYANTHFLGNELCQYTDAARFNASYDKWVWLAARQLFDLGLAPKDKVTLWSHLEISQTFQGNHEDPIAYLASHGKTWANVVADVTNYYNAMVAEQNAKPAPKPVAPSPVAKPSAPVVTKEQIHFPPNKGTWRVYPLDKQPVVGNEKGSINPTKFGGLTYDVLGHPFPGVVTIKTGDFGVVNVAIADATVENVVTQAPTAPVAAPASNGIIAQVRVIASALNIRKGPGTQYPIIEVAPKGKVFNVTGNINDWHEVIVDDHTKGYAFGNKGTYLELV